MKNNELYIKDALYINPYDFSLYKGNIKVYQGKEGKIEFIDKIPENATLIIDAQGGLTTKSFVIGHHHIYSALATGMPAPEKKPSNFYEILKYVWWNLDKKLSEQAIEASALSTAIYALKAGATFIIDHHASPNFITGSLEIIANALEKVGLSHLLCYEISDRDGHDKAIEGLEETKAYLQKHQGLIGLHASFTLEDTTLKQAADLMDSTGSGIHIHVAEDKVDEDLCTIEHGKRVIHRLKDFGFLNSSKTILAHAIHINDEEREILSRSRAWIVQNPESNLNNQVGFFSTKGLDTSRIMLGTDGMHSDMIQSAKFAYFAGLAFEQQDMDMIYQRLRNNDRYLAENNFKGHADNNIVIFDYQPRTPITSANFLGHFFYALSSSHVRHVISNGKIVLKDRKVTTVNEEAVFAMAQQQAQILWKKL